VPNAPEELYDFMQALETVPDWIDIELVKRGARVGRVFMSLLAPFSIRGAFIATFMNKYSGMPMALTGALSRKGSGKQRINETASFFTAATRSEERRVGKEWRSRWAREVAERVAQ